MSSAVPDLWRVVTIWFECRKTQVMGCIGLVGGNFSLQFSFKGCAEGWAIPNKVAWGIPESPLKSSRRGDSVYPCWQLCQWGWLVSASLPWQLTSYPPMVADSLWWSGQAAITLFTHQSQPIMYHPEMVDDCALVLATLPHQGQWVTP